jgi:hypothetical protein
VRAGMECWLGSEGVGGPRTSRIVQHLLNLPPVWATGNPQSLNHETSVAGAGRFVKFNHSSESWE